MKIMKKRKLNEKKLNLYILYIKYYKNYIIKNLL